jgi:hypothetical protein
MDIRGASRLRVAGRAGVRFAGEYVSGVELCDLGAHVVRIDVASSCCRATGGSHTGGSVPPVYEAVGLIPLRACARS